MNTQQWRAIEQPAYMGFEAARPRLGRRRGDHTEVLSVNAGYE